MYREYQDKHIENDAASKVAALLASFKKNHPLEWLCCGWKNDAIAELVLGNLGNVKDGRRTAEVWLREHWDRKRKEQRELEAAFTLERRARVAAASDVDTLQFLDEQEKWLNSLDPALLDPGNELLPLLEKRRRGIRSATYSDYTRFVTWLNENWITLRHGKRGKRLLDAGVRKFHHTEKTILSLPILSELCAAYQRAKRSIHDVVDPYPLVLAVMAKKREARLRRNDARLCRARRIEARWAEDEGLRTPGKPGRRQSKNLEFGGNWIPAGFQVRKVRRPQKDVPAWANNDVALRSRILSPAMRLYRIANLYWCCGWNAREVGEELGMSTGAVKTAIIRLKNA
jgi:hypothetical protein